MKKASILLLSFTLLGTAFAQVPSRHASPDASIQVFWEKFKGAVIKGDKETVAALARFPISMPFGFSDIRNKAQLRKYYRDIFFEETNAAKCFSKARPQIEKKNSFYVACSFPGGEEEPLVYSFTRTRNGWRFTGFDNINE